MFAMFEGPIIPLLFAPHIVLYAAIAWALVSKYRRTRDPGLLWLGVALVIWPIVSFMLDCREQHVLNDLLSSAKNAGAHAVPPVQQYPSEIGALTSWLMYLHPLAGPMLVLVAVLNLYKHGRRP